MTTIDFKQFCIFTDITQTEKVNVDISKTLADILNMTESTSLIKL